MVEFLALVAVVGGCLWLWIRLERRLFAVIKRWVVGLFRQETRPKKEMF